MARVEEKFDAELAAERDSYLRELLSNLEELETVILDLSGTDKETEQTRMLARQIHTIKGTAGSLGLDLLSAAAHRMEDLFADPRRRENTNEKFIDQLLAQNDLLASIAEAYLDDNERFLDDVRSQLGETAPATPAAATETKCLNRILIVEPSAEVAEARLTSRAGQPVIEYNPERSAARQRYSSSIATTRELGRRFRRLPRLHVSRFSYQAAAQVRDTALQVY